MNVYTPSNCDHCNSSFTRTSSKQKHCSDECRFWSKVNKTDNCWDWTGNFSRNGSGSFNTSEGNGTSHRYSWSLHFGTVEKELRVLHTCGNQKCVRPDHLVLGDNKKKDTSIVRAHYKGRNFKLKACIACGAEFVPKVSTSKYCSNRCTWERYIKKGDGCWGWRGSKDTRGYGMFKVEENRNMKAHRYSYEFYRGPIPEGMFVCHSCDNRLCTNPDHLFLGSARDNSKDMVDKERSARGEKHSQRKLTEEQVRAIRADPRVQRVIAEEYGLSQQGVNNIKTGRNWGWLK
jgi:hypothetical protein